MKKKEAKFLHWIHYLNLGLALIYALFRYYLRIDGDFGEASHPFQPYLQYAHILAVPLLIFAVGSIFRTHILEKMKSFRKENRRSGWMLCAFFLIMLFSGYLLQTSLYGSARNFVIGAHLISSLLWAFFYLIHHKRARKLHSLRDRNT